jgi:hypothetical protein
MAYVVLRLGSLIIGIFSLIFEFYLRVLSVYSVYSFNVQNAAGGNSVSCSVRLQHLEEDALVMS